MVCSTDATAELTEEDISTLGDRKAMTRILREQVSPWYRPLTFYLRDHFSEYVDLWLQRLDYVSREASKERWDDTDKVRVRRWVYLLPINDLIHYWQQWLGNNLYVDGLDFAFELFSKIPQRLPNPRSLLQESGFVPLPSGSQEYKFYGGTLKKEYKVRYFRIRTVLKAATEECANGIQNLKKLYNDAHHENIRFGLEACLAFAQDFEEWLNSGEFKWEHWRTFQRQQCWRWRYDVGNLRADFYFIIQFFLTQLGLLPEMVNLEPLPEKYEEMCRQVETQSLDF
jgi:hypothetical protein